MKKNSTRVEINLLRSSNPDHFSKIGKLDWIVQGPVQSGLSFSRVRHLQHLWGPVSNFNYIQIPSQIFANIRSSRESAPAASSVRCVRKLSSTHPYVGHFLPCWCHFSFPADTRVDKISRGSQDLQMWGCLQLSEEGFTCCFLLPRLWAADTSHHLCSAPVPVPGALGGSSTSPGTAPHIPADNPTYRTVSFLAFLACP